MQKSVSKGVWEAIKGFELLQLFAAMKKRKKFLLCNANHDSRFLLIFLQLLDIKEPSVLVESVLWTQYSLQYESNHPCSRSVWQSCVSICYFQIVLQSANKTGCLRRW